LEATLVLASDRLNLREVKLVRQYSEEDCFVMVDRDKIKVAFLNLILNAVEAMEGKEGVLTLTTRRENNKCYISITDNGVGMDEETVQSLFEPFFTKKPKGNGLGLTNTQNIILNHKGSIYVNSEPGKGTSFIVYLDLA
jgi:signal transduction histidine kinase